MFTISGQTINDGPPPTGSARLLKMGLYISISPVTPASGGEYICLAKVNNAEMIRIYNLTVGNIPFSFFKLIYKTTKPLNMIKEISFLLADPVHTIIKASGGFDVSLPCYFPSSRPVLGNALWFKESIGGERKELHPEDDSGNEEKLVLLYPEDHDQTIVLKQANAEDAGIYSCETVEGENLHTIHLFVKGILCFILFNQEKTKWDQISFNKSVLAISSKISQILQRNSKKLK